MTFLDKISNQIDNDKKVIISIRHYGRSTRLSLEKIIEAIRAKYNLNRKFAFNLKVFLIELINNALRENYFFFITNYLWDHHQQAVLDATGKKPQGHQAFNEYLQYIRSSLGFIRNVTDFNMQRMRLKELYLDIKDEGILNQGEYQALKNVTEEYKLFTRKPENITRLVISAFPEEISFTVTNKSFLDEIALHRIKNKVIERIKNSPQDANEVLSQMDESQGGHGLGTALLSRLLSENGFNTIKESLVITPNAKKNDVTITLTLDIKELELFSLHNAAS